MDGLADAELDVVRVGHENSCRQGPRSANILAPTTIKRTFPTVKEIGVCMTLAGYWNSIIQIHPGCEDAGITFVEVDN